jgi:hypothetical protein
MLNQLGIEIPTWIYAIGTLAGIVLIRLAAKERWLLKKQPYTNTKDINLNQPIRKSLSDNESRRQYRLACQQLTNLVQVQATFSVKARCSS